MPKTNIKDKLKKTSALLLTCLIVTLSVMLPDPPKVHAADDNTSKYLYVIGTVAAYGGINIDVNTVATRFPNFVDDVMALADEIYTEYASTYGWTNNAEGHTGGGSHRDGSDGVIQAANDIQGYLDYLVSGLQPFNPVASLVDYRFVFCLIRAISRWCSENLNGYTPPAENAITGTLTVNANSINIRTKGSIQFNFPEIPSDLAEYVIDFPFNNCHFTFYLNASQYTVRSLFKYSNASSGDHTPRYNCHVLCIYPNDYDFYFCYYFQRDNYASKLSLNSLYNKPISSSYSSLYMDAYFLSDNSSAAPFMFFRDNFNYSCLVGDDVYCYNSVNNRYGFYASDNSTVFQNRTFSNYNDLCAWIFSTLGIDYYQSTTYISVDTTPPPITINNTTYDQTINNITSTITSNDYHEGDTVTMVFPSYYTTNNYYNYDDYRQHPEYILDFNQDGLLNTYFNMPSYDGNILATKFPFCIPFDVYNLVSNLVATPEAPQFHWLVLPADSFGLGNDAFYIDLDFTPYNFLVQLMRFFLAAGFVIWLMTKTKDLMQ